MEQIVQLLGAAAILTAFVAAQMRAMTTDSWWYIVLNIVGGATLAVVAFFDQDWGFLLLETVWAIVSVWAGLTKLRAGGERAGGGGGTR